MKTDLSVEALGRVLKKQDDLLVSMYRYAEPSATVHKRALYAELLIRVERTKPLLQEETRDAAFEMIYGICLGIHGLTTRWGPTRTAMEVY